jgi:predicted dehydrogenase
MKGGGLPMINIAQLGVGYWGPNLLRNLVAHKKCKISTVVDLSPERRDFVRGLYPAVHVTDDIEAVISDPGIEAVVIATPVATHFDLAVRVLNAGKHILVEKPMAQSVSEVEEIGRLACQKNLVAMVGHTFLYNSAVRYVKNMIDSGDIGDVRYIYSQRLNLGKIRSDVDALWNLAPHDISIIQYWLGDPDPLSVVRRGVDFIQDNIDDVVFMSIIYPKKIMANIHVSWLDPQKIRTMVIIGSKKMVVYDDMADNKIVIYDKGIDQKIPSGANAHDNRSRMQSFDHRSGDVLMPKIEFKEPLRVEIDHFIDCIQNGASCLTGVDHAKKVVRILSSGSRQ